MKDIGVGPLVITKHPVIWNVQSSMIVPLMQQSLIQTKGLKGSLTISTKSAFIQFLQMKKNSVVLPQAALPFLVG